MKLPKVSALAAVSILAFAACSTPGASTAPSAGGGGGDTSKGTVNIAIELPLQGSELAASQPIVNGIRLAVKQAGGAAGGYAIEIPDSMVFDDALNGAHDPQNGANTAKIVGEPNVSGSAAHSSVASADPVSNERPLHAPANTNPDLTRGSRRRDTDQSEQRNPRVPTDDVRAGGGAVSTTC